MNKYEGVMKKYQGNIKEFPNVTSSGGLEDVLANPGFTSSARHKT